MATRCVFMLWDCIVVLVLIGLFTFYPVLQAYITPLPLKCLCLFNNSVKEVERYLTYTYMPGSRFLVSLVYFKIHFNIPVLKTFIVPHIYTIVGSKRYNLFRLLIIFKLCESRHVSTNGFTNYDLQTKTAEVVLQNSPDTMLAFHVEKFLLISTIYIFGIFCC